MAKKQNKISVNQMDKIVELNKVDIQHISYETGDGVVEIDVSPYLSLSDRDGFINDVADVVFSNGVYKPSRLNFVYKYCLLAYCTNVNLPKDAEKISKMINTIDIADRVDEIINDKYLYSDILDEIEFRKNSYLKNSKADEFISSLTALIDNFNKIAESDEFKGQNLNEIVDTIKKLADKDEHEITSAILDFNEEKAKQDGETE